MTYDQNHESARDSRFTNRLRVAIAEVALEVVGEAAGTGGGGVTADQKRHDLAAKILNPGVDDRLELAHWSYAAVAAQPGSAGVYTDAQIKTRVVDIWNDIAGVQAAD